jgi:MSHA pilin protein MshD
MSSRLRERGVTLIELVIFIVIIGIAVTGLLRVLAVNTIASADPVRRKQALMIAESLLEEVEQAAFTYCDPSAAEATTAANTAGCSTIPEAFGQNAPEPVNARPFDNVNDYVSGANVEVEAFKNAQGKISDANGTPLTDDKSYVATVKITPSVLNGVGTAGASADTDALRITLKVVYGTGSNESIVLEGYRTRYAPSSP